MTGTIFAYNSNGKFVEVDKIYLGDMAGEGLDGAIELLKMAKASHPDAITQVVTDEHGVQYLSIQEVQPLTPDELEDLTRSMANCIGQVKQPD